MGEVTGLGLLAAQEDMLAIVHMLQEIIESLKSFFRFTYGAGLGVH